MAETLLPHVEGRSRLQHTGDPTAIRRPLRFGRGGTAGARTTDARLVAIHTGGDFELARVRNEGEAYRHETELWAVTKGERKLRCVALYLPNGIGLRLMEADDFRRTELRKDGDLAEVRSMGWKQALEERGWR